jgi:hypothetical protein
MIVAAIAEKQTSEKLPSVKLTKRRDVRNRTM